MLLCLAIFCENFVTFQGLTIYYETYIKLLDLFHQAFSSLNSDREPDVYYHNNKPGNSFKLIKIKITNDVSFSPGNR